MGSKDQQLMGKSGTAEALQVIESQDRAMADECAKRFKEAYRAASILDADWERKVIYETDFILSLTKGREQLKKVQEDLNKKKGPEPIKSDVLRFQISSLTLREFHQFLVTDPNGYERLILVTGSVSGDGVRVLSRMEKVKMEAQSAGHVKANDAEAHLRIISLTEVDGHQLFAMFHSHMSKGANSTMPSGTDMAYQNRLVKIGCDAIGGIFSLDGYVRFFSTWKNFELEVYGNGVKQILDNQKEKVFLILNMN